MCNIWMCLERDGTICVGKDGQLWVQLFVENPTRIVDFEWQSFLNTGIKTSSTRLGLPSHGRLTRQLGPLNTTHICAARCASTPWYPVLVLISVWHVATWREKWRSCNRTYTASWHRYTLWGNDEYLIKCYRLDWLPDSKRKLKYSRT